MRMNFNQPLAATLASAALVAAPSARAEGVPAASGLDPACVSSLLIGPLTPGITSYNLSVGPGKRPGSAAYTMLLEQDGSLTTGGVDPAACGGSLAIQETLQIQAGTYTQTLPKPRVLAIPESAAPVPASGSFSIVKACKVARDSGAGSHRRAQLVATETRTYSVGGESQSATKKLGKVSLACGASKGTFETSVISGE